MGEEERKSLKLKHEQEKNAQKEGKKSCSWYVNTGRKIFKFGKKTRTEQLLK